MLFGSAATPAMLLGGTSAPAMTAFFFMARLGPGGQREGSVKRAVIAAEISNFCIFHVLKIAQR